MFFAQPEARAEVIDKVVAIVNNEVITMSDFDQEVAPLQIRIESQAPPAEREGAIKNVRQQVLERMIETSLIQQKARELGIEVDDAELNR